MSIDKKVAIYPDLKWLGFWISYPIQNLDHLKTNLCLAIQNPDLSGFQIPSVLYTSNQVFKLIQTYLVAYFAESET